MTNSDDKKGSSPANEEPSKSSERDRQEDLLDRTSRQEPFIDTLRRARDESKGRPKPGKRSLPRHRDS